MKSKLLPCIHPIVAWFLEHDKIASQTLPAFHVVFPQIFKENVDSFLDCGTRAGIDLRVLYAMKANKSPLFCTQVALSGIGFEASSLYELRKACSFVDGRDIVVSGPCKSTNFLLEAGRVGATIAIDCSDEIEVIRGLVGNRKISSPRVLMRLNLPEGESRFGLLQSQVQSELSNERNASSFDFCGFSFHLAGYDLADRVTAFGVAFDNLVMARKQGFSASVINIGGGFPIRYVEKDSWDAFVQSPPQFFRGKEFTDLYPYYGELVGADFLMAFLDAKYNGRSIRQLLDEEGIVLMVEPGRALLDQAGLSCFRVNGCKGVGQEIVVVDGNINMLSEQWFNSEFCVDPLLVPFRSGIVNAFSACVAGNTCLESDMLAHRIIEFDRIPERGDFLVWLNTAGYQMDTNESEFELIPIPPKFGFVYEKGLFREV